MHIIVVLENTCTTQQTRNHGFALVVTVSMLVLLTLLAVGMLSLSSLALNHSSIDKDMEQARANARMALVIALGELQFEMGPDMRISSESAIFDQNPATEAIDGVSQSHWLASYGSWGNWLNANYTSPSGSTLSIQNTYVAQRAPMFRRWLLSMPDDMSLDITLPLRPQTWSDDDSVVMVGEGTLGRNAAQNSPHKLTRAYLISVGERGKFAWWIGPENHKANIQHARKPRELSPDQWESASGDTAEVGAGAIEGLEPIDLDPTLSSRLISYDTLELTGVSSEDVGTHFYDLTASSKGLLTSVRSGHLKKDLSLLFEKGTAQLPDRYRFDMGDLREPSIRPMSNELAALNPQTPNRHFASWTGMRHFYRMYRQDSDALSLPWTDGGTGGSPGLNWENGKPYADVLSTSDCFSTQTSNRDWDGRDTYMRMPILAKLTFIYSLMTRNIGNDGSGVPRYRCYLVYTPVYTYWNPYNTELRIPDGHFAVLSAAYKALPIEADFTIDGVTRTQNILVENTWSRLRPENGGDVVFAPGEFRVFSHASHTNGDFEQDMVPGFDPQAYGGQLAPGAFGFRDHTNGGRRYLYASQRPTLSLRFANSIWGGNVTHGNTPGSLDVVQDWAPGTSNQRKRFALNYQVDWFNTSQTFTPITDPNDPQSWIFDGQPVPIGYAQLTMKGLSEYDYETIDWSRDWRCRNWLHAPAFNLGSGLYCSENEITANTQRTNSPYVMNFGPMSMAEMPSVVFHNGPRAFLGSGASPFEKVNAAPAIELPSAPISSLAGFSGMRTKPGWTEFNALNPAWRETPTFGNLSSGYSMYGCEVKALAYHSGVTGPGIGNSFAHPIIPRGDVYRFFNNSVSMDPVDRRDLTLGYAPTDTRAFSDYWDHTLLLNDALWDDYFLSSLSNQTRPGATAANTLRDNLQDLANGEPLANSRYRLQSESSDPSRLISELEDSDGYLKASSHLVIDGMFNVNSTSVDAWHALFAGIRERQLHYRNRNGTLLPVEVPPGKRIAISRFNTPTTDQENTDPEYGIRRDDGTQAWSGIRFLDNDQLRLLAEKCVEQVKRRGPFLNFSEFINRRLSNDDLGLMGALQAAIDYDDDNPEPESINYAFKRGTDFMMREADMAPHDFATPGAANGSRFAGIPGYVIQSDLLKPIANTMSVRDDTFRIRAYGESRDAKGRVVARAWCEAIVQRKPEYVDPTNSPHEASRILDSNGNFNDNPSLTNLNRVMGRKFQVESFRWLMANEI